jgi:hypothetical protein
MIGLDVLSATVGLAIAVIVIRRDLQWYWAAVTGVIVGLAFDGVFDGLTYGRPFALPHAMLADVLAFSLWATLIVAIWRKVRHLVQ